MEEEFDVLYDKPEWASPQHLQGMEDGHSLERRKSRMECIAVQIRIDSTKTVTLKSSSHTLYCIHVSPGINSWLIERRYSDFVYLNQQIQKHHPSLTLPPLPKKTIFTSATSSRVVDERKAMFESYLRTIVRIASVWNRSELARFLDNESNSMMFVWNFERMQKMQTVRFT